MARHDINALFLQSIDEGSVAVTAEQINAFLQIYPTEQETKLLVRNLTDLKMRSFS